MTQQELVKFLTLLYHTGGLNPYWKDRLKSLLLKAGARAESVEEIKV